MFDYELPRLDYELPQLDYELPRLDYELPQLDYELPRLLSRGLIGRLLVGFSQILLFSTSKSLQK